MKEIEFSTSGEAFAFASSSDCSVDEIRSIPYANTRCVHICSKEEYSPSINKSIRTLGKRTTDMVIKDIEPYKSPLGTGWVTSRNERREELKRNGLREVDPSEMKVEYTNERFKQKHGIEQ